MKHCRFNTPCIPPIGEAQYLGVIGHKIDLELAKSHTANDRVLRRLGKSLLPQLILHLRPFCISSQIDDQIDIISRPDIFQGNRVRYE